MEELKKYCPDCEEERNIVEIRTTRQREIIKFSCGHEYIAFELLRNSITVDSLQKRYRSALSQLINGYSAIIGSLIRGKRKRPTKTQVLIDWKKKIILFNVWEQNQEGEWVPEYQEEKSFKK